MNYKVGDDVTNGFSTGTIIAINENQRQVRWKDGTKTWESEGLMPVRNCENCRYNALADNEGPCLSCGDGDDNNWEASTSAVHNCDSPQSDNGNNPETPTNPVHNRETCKYESVDNDADPCYNCDDTGDHWKPKEFTERAEHYKRLSPETIQRAQDVLTPEQFQGAMLYTMMRYIERFGHKDDPLKEALKISDYAGYLVKSLEGRRVTDD